MDAEEAAMRLHEKGTKNGKGKKSSGKTQKQVGEQEELVFE